MPDDNEPKPHLAEQAREVVVARSANIFGDKLTTILGALGATAVMILPSVEQKWAQKIVTLIAALCSTLAGAMGGKTTTIELPKPGVPKAKP